MLKGVRMRPEEHDAEGPRSQILLVPQILVDGHECLAERSDGVKQRSVIEVGAAERAANGRDRVPRDVSGEAFGHACIEDNAHGRLRGGDDGLAEQRLARELQHRNRVFARDRGKVLQKLTERMAPFDVVDHRAHRDACPGEAGLTAEAIGGDGNERSRQGHREGQNRVTRRIAGACSCV